MGGCVGTAALENELAEHSGPQLASRSSPSGRGGCVHSPGLWPSRASASGARKEPQRPPAGRRTGGGGPGDTGVTVPSHACGR